MGARTGASTTRLNERKREVEEHAVQVFGAVDVARVWMGRPNRTLGNQLPRKLLRSTDGIENVDVILGRIEHGIIS